MKKILLATIVALSFFVADAQTTTSKSKKKKAKKTYVSSESKAKARQKAEYARIQKETDKKIEDYRLASFQEDSMRIDSERVAKENFEIERKLYLETKTREQDSVKQLTVKKLNEQKELSIKTDQTLDAINRAANLSTYQGGQVKIINQTYNDKARMVRENLVLTDEQRKQELTTLNTERKAKITAVLGKARHKKLEKERREYIKMNGEDSQAKWIDEVEGYANNK